MGDEPYVSYIFPAGGRRGATVAFHVGGHGLHDRCRWEIEGPGVTAPRELTRGASNLWFEGPLIPLPDSQRKEDYPWPQVGELSIAADAPLGVRHWRVWNSQGVTPRNQFVIGDLPEIVEQEVDGAPIPQSVATPVTINGRIYPREDVDIWKFQAEAGEQFTCEVMAQRLGSPLDARLAVFDAQGKLLPATHDAVGADARLRFTATAAGEHSVHLYDAGYEGQQHYVYRLTITSGPWVDSIYPLGGRRGAELTVVATGAHVDSQNFSVTLPDSGDSFLTALPAGESRTNPVSIQLGDLEERLEREQPLSGENSGGESGVPPANACAVPCALNGRIAAPGQVDRWQFAASKGQRLIFQAYAAQLGSPLDAVLEVVGPDGRSLAKNDDQGGSSDPRLVFAAPQDGEFTLLVSDTFQSRGGPDFGYRVIAQAEPEADFELQMPVDCLNLPRGAPVKLKFTCQRIGDLTGPIQLEFSGLPAGVTVEGAEIGAKKNDTQVTFAADEHAQIDIAKLSVWGVAKREAGEIRRPAAATTAVGDAARNELLLAVTLPTPFKVIGDFETRYAARGATYWRHYRVERNGFDGPLEIRMAERQVRHLQGVTGPVITVPAGESEFDYPIHLKPWMEVGRTSRTCVTAIGLVEEADGKKHPVSYTSHSQDDQIIVLVDPAQLDIRLLTPSVKAAPNSEIVAPFQIGKNKALQGAVTVALIVPQHLRGIAADSVTLDAESGEGALTIRLGERPGPFNMPLVVRATIELPEGPSTAEALLELVAP